MTTNAFRAAKLVAAALVSTVGLSQVTVASGCESRADPQDLLASFSIPPARSSRVRLRFPDLMRCVGIHSGGPSA
jgi:hypothetical protein